MVEKYFQVWLNIISIISKYTINNAIIFVEDNMAKNTDLSLQKEVIYSIYVRNHTQEGTFNSIVDDLDRIKDLGVDIIWFMPIHPIGVDGKKGSLGCPYSNQDYRTVNPEYGTMQDFKNLVNEIHNRDMKCIIDVVYNHTSPDSNLSKTNPEFFYRKSDGSFGNKVGDWTDVIDLDYSNKELWKYQIDTLKMWAKIVDGFRCDVATFIPAEFWIEARKEVSSVNPSCIWLAETVHSSFNVFYRKNGMYAASDYELYSAFDMEYEYDIREAFDKYLRSEKPLSYYLEMLNFQEGVYPTNYNKLRFLENHDTPRICSYIINEHSLKNFTAMLYFLKGATLIYAGQEYENSHLPSLFEKDVIDRNTHKNISQYMKKLSEIKHNYLDSDDFFKAYSDDEHNIAILQRDNNINKKVGIFSLRSLSAEVSLDINDGEYTNLIDNSKVTVQNSRLYCNGNPIIINFSEE